MCYVVYDWHDIAMEVYQGEPDRLLASVDLMFAIVNPVAKMVMQPKLDTLFVLHDRFLGHTNILNGLNVVQPKTGPVNFVCVCIPDVQHIQLEAIAIGQQTLEEVSETFIFHVRLRNDERYCEAVVRAIKMYFVNVDVVLFFGLGSLDSTWDGLLPIRAIGVDMTLSATNKAMHRARICACWGILWIDGTDALQL